MAWLGSGGGDQRGARGGPPRRYGRSAGQSPRGGWPQDGRRGGPGQRGGFGFAGPFPTWSGRTRRGTRVRVGGCCLPIPLVMSAGVALGLRQVLRR